MSETKEINMTNEDERKLQYIIEYLKNTNKEICISASKLLEIWNKKSALILLFTEIDILSTYCNLCLTTPKVKHSEKMKAWMKKYLFKNQHWQYNINQIYQLRCALVHFYSGNIDLINIRNFLILLKNSVELMFNDWIESPDKIIKSIDLIYSKIEKEKK